MSRISVFEEQNRIRAAKPVTGRDITFMDSFDQAVTDTLRTLPTATLMRGARNLFDSSEEIDASEANYKFNLQDEARYEDGETVSMDQASERAEDQAQLARSEYVQGLYAKENPVLGTVANLTGSIAAGFMDPTLIALNVGASVAMTRGLTALASTRVGANAVNSIGAYNSGMGKAIIQMYDRKAQQTLQSVIMREGAENFVASVAEESVNFAGIGEERLARDVTIGESLRNILVGSTMGTGFGVVLDKAGRSGLMSRWQRLFGDKAPETASLQNKIVDLESDAGVEPDMGYVAKVTDQEVFEAKPWHAEDEAHIIDATETPMESTFYIPRDGDVYKSVSTRGKSISLTNSSAHAQNMGKNVDKVTLEDTSILTPKAWQEDDLIRRSMAEDMADDLLRHTDPERNRVLLETLYDDVLDNDLEVDYDELWDELVNDLEGSADIDALVNRVEQFSTVAHVETFHHDIVNNVLDASDYSGYTYQGKGMSGEAKYTGVTLTEAGQAKLKKVGETEVQEPSFKDKETERLRKAAQAEEYAGALEKRARATRTEEDTKEMLPETLEGTGDEFTLEDSYATNARSKEMVDEAYDDLIVKKEDPEGKFSEEDQLLLDELEDMRSGRTVEQAAEENKSKLDSFEECITGVAKPKFAPDDIDF